MFLEILSGLPHFWFKFVPKIWLNRYISDARMAVISAGAADDPRGRVIKKCIQIICGWVTGG